MSGTSGRRATTARSRSSRYSRRPPTRRRPKSGLAAHSALARGARGHGLTPSVHFIRRDAEHSKRDRVRGKRLAFSRQRRLSTVPSRARPQGRCWRRKLPSQSWPTRSVGDAGHYRGGMKALKSVTFSITRPAISLPPASVCRSQTGILPSFNGVWSIISKTEQTSPLSDH